MTARSRRTAAIAAALSGIASLTLAGGASAAEDSIRIRTAGQGGALAKGAISVQVRVAGGADVVLRASAPGARRFTGRERTSFKEAGKRTVFMLVTGAGRFALEAASSRCEELTIRVAAAIDGDGPGKGSRRSDSRSLAPDLARCAKPSPPAPSEPGPGDEPAPPAPTPGPGDPGPDPDPDPDPDPVETKLRAGAATADITPPVGTPMFAYTARSKVMRMAPSPPDDPADPQQWVDSAVGGAQHVAQVIGDPDHNHYAKSFEESEGIHTRLRASAIVIERQGEKFALVQADLGGLPYALVQAVEDRLGDIGIDGEHIVLSATHSHSATGPIWPADNGGYQALGGDFFDPRVFGLTADGIAEAIIRANGALEPARAGLGTSRLEGASNNRAFEAFQRNEDVPDALEQELKLNRTVTVLRVDGADGAPIGAWSNFSVHQTSFGDENLLFSGDNAATTERLVEREIAEDAGLPAAVGAPGESAGPVLVWSNGAEGDVSPNGSPHFVDGEPLEYVNSAAGSANMAGIKVAEGILRAWEDAGGSLAGELELESRQTFKLLDGDEADGMPVGPITALGFGIVEEGFCSPFPEPVEPAGPGQGSKFPLVAGAGLVPQTAPVSLLRIGDTAIVSMPFEITTQMGRRITDAVVAGSGGELDSGLIAGLTNGYLSYTATPEEYDSCNYEGSFTLFGRHQGPLLRDTATSLVPSLLGTGEAPAADPEPPPLGVGTPNFSPAPPTPTPETIVTPPADTRRFERASFTWSGGDPSVDAQRGKTFVSLQRQEGPGEWRTIGTEDGPEDTTFYDDEAGTWTETWQFSNCEPVGTYRFLVTGTAVTAPGEPPQPYRVESPTFELAPTAPLEVVSSGVTDGTAQVRARYPAPSESLLALPRQVRTGTAKISLAGGGEVTARPVVQKSGFEASVPEGSSIAEVSVTDGCGNSTG